MKVVGFVKDHRFAAGVFLASFFLTVYASAWSYAALGSYPQQLILRFNEYSGITKTGGVWEAVLLGLSGSVLVIVNFFLAILLEDRERFLGRLVTGATLFAALLIFITISAIISVN
jgi:hypothetical protein